MNATIINLIIQLVSGAVGGSIACGLMKSLSLGPIGNSIAGIVGGGLGDRSEHADAGRRAGAGAAVGGLDIGSIVAQIAGVGVGGGVVMAIVGQAREIAELVRTEVPCR